jgi:hypothetical protein
MIRLLSQARVSYASVELQAENGIKPSELLRKVKTREHEKRASRANPSFSRRLLGGAHARRLTMQVYAFRGRGRIFGFTANRSGDNLPAEHGPWVEFKTLDLVRGEAQAGVNVDECLDDIDEFGIHLTDAHVRITQ